MTGFSEKIAVHLNACTRDLPGKGASNREWTQRVMQCLTDLGIEKKWNVACSSIPGVKSGEWLWDLIWYSTHSDHTLDCIELAVECEWNPDLAELRLDFEKLLVARAERRLFIFDPCLIDLAQERVRELVRGEIRCGHYDPSNPVQFIAYVGQPKGFVALSVDHTTLEVFEEPGPPGHGST